ncbi:MAG: type IV secretory system conjugative DNA transfer family protein [Spiroplasma sp.]|nr:type IV secretory system conjugative DNA transfer family protein [Spiroplasma sp.]
MKTKSNKEKIWLLIIGLIIIPIIFTILTTIIGVILTITVDHNWQFDLIQYWKTAINNKFSWLLSLLLSISVYFYYAFKIFQGKNKQATIKKSQQKVYGQARWASKKELNSNYPLVNDTNQQQHHGFVINTDKKKKQVMFNIRTNTHSLVIGGTGSGKTQGLVLPTISINSKSIDQPSMVITDPKGELYQEQKEILTQQGYQVLALNLRDVTASIAWNPLASIYQQFKTMILTNDEQETLQLRVRIQSDIQDLTKTLFSSKYQDDPFWTNSGALITEAIILAMLEDAQKAINQSKLNPLTTLEQELPLKKFNLGSVTIIAAMQKEMIEWIKNRDDTSSAKITASQVLVGESKTLNSVLMTISTHLAIFKNDFIRNLTCNNNLNFEDFINKPTALFIIVPDENHNYYVFIALLISQLYKFLVNKANDCKNNRLPRPVYFLCDEFGNIPAIANLDAMITVARSRNIFFQLILQDLQQLTSKYGKEKGNIIFTNCNLHIFLQTIDLTTAERYSKMIGDTTVIQVATSGSINSTNKTKNQSETLTGHRLILASDLMKLAPNQAIIFYARENPVKTKLIPWHQIKPLISKEQKQSVRKKIKLINFNQDHYYDIKLKLAKTISKPKIEIKQKATPEINLTSKSAIKNELLRLEAKLLEYHNDGSIAYQKFIINVKKQIKLYQDLLGKIK